MNSIASRLDKLSAETLRNLHRGIERESLRTRSDGQLSERPHPEVLGSALTHPQITTDFCESQLELVTGVHDSIEDCLAELTDTHQLVYHYLKDERLWSASMPCYLPDDNHIPIAQFGSSNIGRSKTVYRNGLAHRYGRRMQTISGVHYNFSLPDTAWPELLDATDPAQMQACRNKAYFGLIRNFRRYSWLLLYLFGASPAVCGSFVQGREHRLEPIGKGSMYLPYGTSMRMGPLGYQSDAQRTLAVSYNNLQVYAASLKKALTQPYPAYTAIGIRDGDDYRQLSDTLLQIENEFYGLIRPKRPIHPGERPLHALNERGVEYVEVRCLDIDPFSPVGVSADTTRFIDVFLLWCLLSESPPDSNESIAANNANQLAVAEKGRAPGLTLHDSDGKMQPLTALGEQIIEQCAPIAAALDKANGGHLFTASLKSGAAALADPSLTPSARILHEMGKQWNNSFSAFALHYSEAHQRHHLAEHPDAERLARHAAAAAESWEKQRSLEQADEVDFETYRQQYLAQAFEN